jgi:hypothetical protein
MVHVMKASKLPFYNRDPFDRIIVAQAITENLDFVTKDNVMGMYLENESIKKSNLSLTCMMKTTGLETSIITMQRIPCLHRIK